MHRSPSGRVMKVGTPIARRHLNGLRVSLRGVTLIETLVAFVLVAVGIGVLGELTFWSLNESILSRRRAEAALLAQDRMEDLLAHRSDLGAWEASARSGYQFDRGLELYRFDRLQPEQKRPELAPFRWSWKIEDMDGRPGMKKVLVQLYVLRPGMIGAGPAYDLWTLLALPKNASNPPDVAGTTGREGARQ